MPLFTKILYNFDQFISHTSHSVKVQGHVQSCNSLVKSFESQPKVSSQSINSCQA